MYVCVCVCVCVKTKSFSNETLHFFLQKVVGLLHFRPCQNCISSVNLVA